MEWSRSQGRFSRLDSAGLMIIFVMFVAVIALPGAIGVPPPLSCEEAAESEWQTHPFDTTRLACDTLFLHWYSNGRSDSGFDLVRVDQAGDTMALYLRWIIGPNPHIRVLGPMGGINRGRRTKIWHLHRIEIQGPGEIFDDAEDFCTQGGNGWIENIKLEKTVDKHRIEFHQKWRFIKHVGRRVDTLYVDRRVTASCSVPYFLVHYDFTWGNSEAGMVRFLWYFQRQTRFGRRRSIHEVGYAPGIGIVSHRTVLDASKLGYCALMARIGNPFARCDTLRDGRKSFMSQALREHFGDGPPSFPSGFICFNPRSDIVPLEFAWIDTPSTYVASFHFDSASIHVDTTNVLDYKERYFVGRTDIIVFRPAETKSFEYAVGRALFEDDSLPPIIPEIEWSDSQVEDPAER